MFPYFRCVQGSITTPLRSTSESRRFDDREEITSCLGGTVQLAGAQPPNGRAIRRVFVGGCCWLLFLRAIQRVPRIPRLAISREETMHPRNEQPLRSRTREAADVGRMPDAATNQLQQPIDPPRAEDRSAPEPEVE
jgi:hypothetical protein